MASTRPSAFRRDPALYHKPRADDPELEKNADAILRVCSYHRRDFDLMVVRSRPHEMEAVQATLQSPFKTAPTATMGDLDRLPLELILVVLQSLDVRSFFRFRQVNRRARIVSTDDRSEYQVVARHGLEGLRGLLRAELAPCFTIHNLYSTLLTWNCACGRFGTHLFLFTLERCCMKCLGYSPRFKVAGVSDFARFAENFRVPLDSLPGVRLRTVPGLYGIDAEDQPVSRPGHLLMVDPTIQSLLSASATSESRVFIPYRPSGRLGHRFMAATAFPYYDLGHCTSWPGVTCKGCEIHLETVQRGSRRNYRVYSERGFLAHFTRCGHAQDLWRRSEGGTRSVEEPESIRNGGVMNPLGPDGLPA